MYPTNYPLCLLVIVLVSASRLAKAGILTIQRQQLACFCGIRMPQLKWFFTDIFTNTQTKRIYTV